jgi:hypothetical protein
MAERDFSFLDVFTSNFSRNLENSVPAPSKWCKKLFSHFSIARKLIYNFPWWDLIAVFSQWEIRADFPVEIKSE